MKKHSEEEIKKEMLAFNKKSKEIGLVLSNLSTLPMKDGKDRDNVLNSLLNRCYLRRLELHLVRKLYHPELRENIIDLLSNLFKTTVDNFSKSKDLDLGNIKILQQCELNELQQSKLKDAICYWLEISTLHEITQLDLAYAPLVNRVDDPNRKSCVIPLNI